MIFLGLSYLLKSLHSVANTNSWRTQTTPCVHRRKMGVWAPDDQGALVSAGLFLPRRGSLAGVFYLGVFRKPFFPCCPFILQKNYSKNYSVAVNKNFISLYLYLIVVFSASHNIIRKIRTIVYEKRDGHMYCFRFRSCLSCGIVVNKALEKSLKSFKIVLVTFLSVL